MLNGSLGRFFVIVVAAALLCSGCATTARTPEAAIRNANEQFEENARHRDLERLVREYYGNGSVAVFGGKERVSGLEAAKKKWQELLEKGEIELITDRVESSCDLASEMGRWTLRITPEAHDEREEHGNYYVTWRKVNGEWKAVMQFFSPEGFHEAE